MRFINIADLRKKLGKILLELPQEKELVIMKRGRPIAILTSTDEESVQESLRAWRRIRAGQAIAGIQQESMRKGTDGLSIEEIDAEIKEARLSRKNAQKKCY